MAVGPYLNGAFPDDSPAGTHENWTVENAFPNLTFTDPLALLEVPGENSYYIAGKVGLILQVANDAAATSKDTVLDISSMVDTDGDAGLLNAILHPEFGQQGSPSRGYLYVFYRYHPDGNIMDCETPAFLRLSRFNRPDGTTEFDPNSEFILIQTYDEQCWHNGGGMFFDDEGYFYYTVGDAGGLNDQYLTSQRLDERLMSGLFRIDLDMDPGRSHPIRRQQVDPAGIIFTTESSFQQGYYIPNDNPFLDENGAFLEEYYALGLRSPHRASFDVQTGKIWVADVGQGKREEISLVSKGQNLQWPFREGFTNGDFSPPIPLIGISTPPIYDYTHAMGTSIIGGFVYRGDNYQGALNGRYIFGDHGVRNIWTYNPANGEVLFLANVPGFGQGDKNGIASFAVNSAGEVFVLKLYGTDLDGGVIYKLKQETTVPEPPTLLSQTGAFSDLATLTPAAGVIPYTINAPLWSDGALKKRWIALPNDGAHDTAAEQITFSETGSWQFPSGTVFIKHFELPVDAEEPGITHRVETRFFVITADGGAYGVTYKWNAAGTDAVLLVSSDSKDFDIVNPDGSPGTQTWDFPSRSDCMTCHNVNADFVLGVKTWQLNGDLTYPSGITDNQLNTWNHLGMFANAVDPMAIPSFLQSHNVTDPSATLESRVRSYLDANCAHCHRPGGVEGAFDARFSTPLQNQNIIWAPVASRNTPDDHYIIKPKDVSESEIWIRDGSLEDNAMPPLAKNLVDNYYMAVLTAYINSLDEEACEEVPVSSLNWANSQNFQGPVEINASVGQEQANDGNPITINGQVFPLGLGVHSFAEITYDVNNDYELFESFVGVDDETCASGSVQFEVYTDGNLAYQSPVLRQSDDALFIQVNIAGAEQVKLVVNDGGDGEACDHGDWADPKFLPCLGCVPGGPCDDGDPCTVNDQYDAVCNCSGILVDSDGDSVPDGCDVCPGWDDMVDLDQDNIPEGCDICPGFDDYIDSDGDGVPDGCDLCPDFDDFDDADGDGIPDGCDDCETITTSICESGDCPVDGNPIPSGEYLATYRITSEGRVAPDGQVTFKTGESIALKPGFKVEAGGIFQASVAICEPGAGAEFVGDPILKVIPNQFPLRTIINYKLPRAAEVSIQLTDLTGQVLLTLLEPAFKEAGAYDLEVEPELPAGVYYAQLLYGAEAVREKLILTRVEVEEKPSVTADRELQVSVRPNPFRSELKLLITPPHQDMKRAVVRVMDINGRVIYQRFDAPFNQETTITPHSGWVNGVYIMQVRAGEYSSTHTIIKQ